MLNTIKQNISFFQFHLLQNPNREINENLNAGL